MTDAKHAPLRPCPYCGANEWQPLDWSPGSYVLDHRAECWLDGPTIVYTEFVAAWNTRAIESELLEALEPLLCACEMADDIGELHYYIDGELLDKARAVIAKATGNEHTKGDESNV